MSLISSPDNGVVKDSEGQEGHSIVRTDCSDMATQVSEVDAANLASGPSVKFYRGVLL